MRTLKGVSEIVLGILIINLEAKEGSYDLLKTIADEIVDSLTKEGNLVIPHIENTGA